MNIFEVNRNIALFVGQIAINLDPIMKNVVKSLQPVFEVMNEIQKAAPQIEKGLKDFFETVKEFDKNFKAMHMIYDKYGWWILPFEDETLSDMLDFAKDLEEMPFDKAKAKLDERVLDYFQFNDCARLSTLIEGWAIECFQKRSEVFKEAFWAHKKQKHILAISALIPQIEGVITDFTGSGKGQWRDNFYEKIHADFRVNKAFDEKESLKKHFSAFKINLNARKFDELFNKGKFTDKKFTATLNRHVITHGRFVDFTALNSLRLFLLLDLLHGTLMEFEVRPGIKDILNENESKTLNEGARSTVIEP